MNFRRLDVYRFAIDHATVATRILAVIPVGYRDIRDQLKRASLSIPLNIAEGAGKTKPADQRRFYAIARGSAMECAAVVDVCRVLRLADATLLDEADQLLDSLVRMLSKLAR